MEKQYGLSLKVFRTNRGGEFTSKDFRTFYEALGIQRQLTTPYTSEQNGVAERKNRMVVEMARCMMKEMNVPVNLWVEAIATVVHILNRSPTQALQNCTPYQALTGLKPSVTHLKVFGCIAFALVNPHQRKKLDSKSEKYLFIGHSGESKAYKLLDPLTGKVIISRDVVFHENKMRDWSGVKSLDGVPCLSAHTPKAVTLELEEDSASEEQPPGHQTGTTEDQHSTSVRYRDLQDIYDTCSFVLTVVDPNSFDETSKSVEWKNAMKEEILSIERNQAWELIELPEEKHAVGLKWIFKPKYHADRTLHRRKARIVAKGYTQRHGIDFDEVFYPVARIETVRLFLAIGAQMKWAIIQLDVKSAFLNGDLHEEVYVVWLEGFEVPGKES